MTFRALRVWALALSAAAFVSSAPLSGAGAATVAHNYHHVTHSRVAHGVHGYVARNHVAHHHYAWRNGRRYAYGYNPGAAVAAGVIGGALGAAAYPYSCDDSYYGSYGACDTGDYAWGGYYGPYYGGYGYYPGFYGRHNGYGFNRFGYGHGFAGAGGHFAGGNFGHAGGFAGGNFGHMGGFGGGHFGGFGGGHFGGGGHFR
jgi:hypothetical protein